MKLVELEPHGLFATLDSWDALMDYVDALNEDGRTKQMFITLVGMTWNLACKLQHEDET